MESQSYSQATTPINHFATVKLLLQLNLLDSMVNYNFLVISSTQLGLSTD